jgi:hypothetical protein
MNDWGQKWKGGKLVKINLNNKKQSRKNTGERLKTAPTTTRDKNRTAERLISHAQPQQQR